MLFSAQGEVKRNRVPLGISLVVHVAVFVLFLEAPAFRLPRASASEYRQKIAGKEEKIVFYKFRRELPSVTPPKAKDSALEVRAEVLARQQMVSSSKDAPQSARMIWTPAPEIAPAPLDLPNVLAVKLPDPPPKAFVAPPDVARRQVSKVDVPDAPELKPGAAIVVAEVKPAALPPKAFVKPAVGPKPIAAAPQLAPDAPAIEAHEVRAALLPAAKLPPKAYVAPVQAARPAIAKAVAAAEAPQLATVAGLAQSGAVAYTPKLPPRPFTAPSGGARSLSAPSGRGHDTEAPPVLDVTSNSKDLSIAIVGLNPDDKAAALPSASSPGQFSAGPVIRPKGADAEKGGSGVTVPDLFVRGPVDRKANMIAQAFAAPTSAENIRAAMNRGEPMTPAHVEPAASAMGQLGATGQPGATKVSGAPDPRFNGREVFMMAIQMPNITSYSGSWLMWYSDRTAREVGLGPIAPPTAHRKVDPKYIATAVSERIEGRVTLACVIDKEGRVRGVELVRGLDERLNQSAEEALAKWEFYPATRKGMPVEVDVLVEIPFHLEPKIERR